MTLIACIGGCSRQRPAAIDIREAALSFSGQDYSRTAHLRLLRDSANHRIADACLAGASARALGRLGIADLERRLDTLAAGHVVRRAGNGCIAGFPVFMDARRRALADVGDAGAAKIAPVVDSLIGPLTTLLGGRRELVFHVLWSRVMDVAWDGAFRDAFPRDTVPGVVWIAAPAHPFTVGTNYYSTTGDAQLAVTWGPKFVRQLSVLDSLSLELNELAWSQPLTDSGAHTGLAQFGMIGAGGASRLLAWRGGSALDSALLRMRDRYAAAAAGAVDWLAAGAKLGVDPRDLFVIALHEIAYATFARLDSLHRLEIPAALKSGAPDSDAGALASLVMGRAPRPADVAIAAYVRNGWRGSPEAVRLLAAAVRTDPRDADARWFLGLSQFDVRSYADAAVTFTALAGAIARDTAERTRRDWAQLWAGHALDAAGRRTEAVAMYRKVAAQGDTLVAMQMGQYGIGPVTAREWARQRLQDPYKPR